MSVFVNLFSYSHEKLQKKLGMDIAETQTDPQNRPEEVVLEGDLSNKSNRKMRTKGNNTDMMMMMMMMMMMITSTTQFKVGMRLGCPKFLFHLVLYVQLNSLCHVETLSALNGTSTCINILWHPK